MQESNEPLEATDLPDMIGEEEKRQNHSHPMDPPAILIMRRKSVRQYPNNQRVALYYIDKLNKYVTVPYTALQWSAGVEEEVTTLDRLKIVVESASVGEQTKDDIFSVYHKLNNENKEKFVSWAQENFNDMLSFVKSNKK